MSEPPRSATADDQGVGGSRFRNLQRMQLGHTPRRLKKCLQVREISGRGDSVLFHDIGDTCRKTYRTQPGLSLGRVESPLGDHCCCCRRPSGPARCPPPMEWLGPGSTSCWPATAAKVRQRSNLDPDGRTASRRAIPVATAELIIRLRRELTRQGLDAGAHTIAWHLSEQHQLTVSDGHDLAHLEAGRVDHPGAEEETENGLHLLRRRAAQPNVAGRLHPLSAHPTRRHTRRRCGDSVLSGRPFPLRPLHHLPPTESPGPSSWRRSGKPSLTRAFPPRCSQITAWSSPPASPAAAPDATPSTASKPNCATWAWHKSIPSRTIPPPAGKWNASTKP